MYKFEMFEEREIALLVILIGVFNFFKGNLGFIYVDVILVIIFLVFEGALLLKTLLGTWKYYSPQFVSPNLHGSINCKPYIIGIWAVIGLGAIKSPLPFLGRDIMIVLPHASIKHIDESLLTDVCLYEVDFEELPDEVETGIRGLYFNKKHVYFGMFKEEYSFEGKIDQLPSYFHDFKTEDITPEEVFNFIRRLENKNEKQKKLLAEDFSAMDKTMSYLDRLGSRKENLLEKAKRFIMDKKEEDQK